MKEVLFLMENIRRLVFLLKKAVEALKGEGGTPRFEFVLSYTEEGRDSYPDTNILAVTGSREKGHQLLVDKVKEYIDSWHEGDDLEHRTKESYLKDGFAELNQFPEVKDNPVLVEAWYLNESDTFVSYLLTRVPVQ